MARVGMDIDVVTSNGSALSTIGDQDIESLIGRVDSLINDLQANWWGPDAQRFHNDWVSTNKPALVTIKTAISTYGQKAVTNAQGQATTSA